VVSIIAFQAIGRGSIPRRRMRNDVTCKTKLFLFCAWFCVPSFFAFALYAQRVVASFTRLVYSATSPCCAMHIRTSEACCLRMEPLNSQFAILNAAISFVECSDLRAHDGFLHCNVSKFTNTSLDFSCKCNALKLAIANHI